MVEGVTVKSIKATSRASVKIKDSYYTLEYCEERLIPENISESDLLDARTELWDTVNAEVDNQIEDILYASKNR